MLVIIPLVCFVCILLAVHRAAYRSGAQPSWRQSVLTACVIWGVFLTAVTECLSYFTALTFGWVLALWSLASIIALSFFFWLGRQQPSVQGVPNLALWKHTQLTRFQLLLLSGVGASITVIALIALVAPPNTWDSMTYHMPRVVHWIQNQSVALYPTNIIRQLHQPPWAEYAILHLQLLSGGDQFANLVEWFSMFGSLVTASVIAQQLGANLRGQLFAIVIVATIPIGILEASSTQNDYVATFWLICCVSFLLSYRTHRLLTDALAAGASLGLALLTKGTSYPLALPFLLWFGVWGLRTLRWRVWQPVLAISLTALLMNISFYTRNLLLFGGPLGPSATTSLYSNENFSLTTLLSNVVRNLSLELATPSNRLDSFLQRAFEHLFNLLGINPNDPQNTWHGISFQINGGNGTWANETLVGSPLQFLLLVLVIVLCLTLRQLRKQHLLLTYLAAIVGAFLLFSLTLKWQIWGGRLLLPLAVLAAPLCAVVLAELSKARLVNAGILFFLLASVPWIVFGLDRPLLGSHSVLTTPRLTQYFVNRPYLEAPYLGAAHFLQSTGCKNLGLYIAGADDWGYPVGMEGWEYPFWVLLNPGNQPGLRIEHVNILNSSAPLAHDAPYATYHPCAIIALRFLTNQSGTLSSNGETYSRAWSSGVIDTHFTIDIFTQNTGASAAAGAPFVFASIEREHNATFNDKQNNFGKNTAMDPQPALYLARRLPIPLVLALCLGFNYQRKRAPMRPLRAQRIPRYGYRS